MSDWLSPWRCYYCGDPATTIDHVVPQSLLRRLEALGDPLVTASLVSRSRIMEVDCCRDCNCRLGNRYHATIGERREALKALLRKKHYRLLSGPLWTASEIYELGPGLQTYVRAMATKRAWIASRIAYVGPATRYGLPVA